MKSPFRFRNFFVPSRRILSASILLLSLEAAAAGAPAWIEKSNLNAKVLLDATNKFSPESASSAGFTEFDDQVADLGPGINERFDAALVGAGEELKKRLGIETDPLVRQDLEILVKSAGDQLETNRLTNKDLLPFIDIGRLIFYGESGLLQDEVAPERRPAALARLKRYTGIESGSTPLAKLARDRYAEAAVDSSRIGPYRNFVEQAVANTGRYTKGIRDLFVRYGLDQGEGADAALSALERQLDEYNQWLQSTVMPRARTGHRLPPEIYADNLKGVGLDISPEVLMRKALLAFAEIRSEMNTLAPLVARERNLPATDYRDVIRALKKEQLPKEQVESHYHGVITRIEDIIRREHIITLPERPMIMRLASEAENAGQPAPHMKPPPLVNNRGERGQFILTTGNPPASAEAKTDGYDDFTYRAAAWTLTAHEGRPGHELQFSAMVERGVSQARSLFAFNSVNVEGWALYAEAEMMPCEPLDAQLVTLQFRLLRAARAFLDPMLNLGLITVERARDVLTRDVCLSEAMTKQEIDRYTFRAPGQATAYFYGYIRLMELRAATEIALGSKFDRRKFNDFVVGQGLLPPDLMEKAVREHFVALQRATKADWPVPRSR